MGQTAIGDQAPPANGLGESGAGGGERGPVGGGAALQRHLAEGIMAEGHRGEVGARLGEQVRQMQRAVLRLGPKVDFDGQAHLQRHALQNRVEGRALSGQAKAVSAHGAREDQMQAGGAVLQIV